jgi:hypothetical protein
MWTTWWVKRLRYTLRITALGIALSAGLISEGRAQNASRFRTVLQGGIHQRDRIVGMAGLELEVSAAPVVWPFVGFMLGAQSNGVIEGGLNLALAASTSTIWYVGIGAGAYDLYSFGPALRAGFEHTLGSSSGLRAQVRWYGEQNNLALVVGVALPGVTGKDQRPSQTRPQGK